MSIASYCDERVGTVARDETLLAAAQRMEKEGLGLLVVMEEEQLAGVLSDRDVALEVAAEGQPASRTRVGDAMSDSPASVRDDLALEEALGVMRAKHVRRLPVVDGDGRVTGLVSLDDLVLLLSREIGGLAEVLDAQRPSGVPAAEGRRSAPVRAAEHYAGEVVVAPATASVAELAGKMKERAVGSVVVRDEAGRAVGLVTDRDVALRLVAAGLDPAATAASAIMSTPLTAADPSDPLERVVERMRSASVRRMPILKEGRAVGLVTFDDLLVVLGGELEQLGSCVAGEIRRARIQSQAVRLRHELEERVEEAAAQLRRLGDQTLRGLGGELEQVVDRVVHTVRRAGTMAGMRAEPRVGDRMETDVQSCAPDDALSEPARIMWERDCGCVPVVARDGSGRVIGMITDRDVCMASYTSGGRLSEMRVEDAMARRVHACHADDPPSTAARLMRSARVRRLPVVDDEGRLRGMLSLADLATSARGVRAAGPAVSEAELARTLEAICRPRGELARRET